jgi:hypothetical protein
MTTRTTSVTPLGIGLIVLLGTVIGLQVNYPLNTIHGCLIIGLINGITAMAMAWAAFSAYDFFLASSRFRR